MRSPQTAIWADEKVGIAWMIDEIDGVRVLSHSGGTTGQVSLLQLVPERGFAVAILTNANRGGAVTREVSRWAFKQYLQMEMPDPKPIESSEEELAAYKGRYSRPFADIDLGLLAGNLVGQLRIKGGFPTKDTPPGPPPPPMSLALCERDRLLVLDGPFKGVRGEAIRKPNGSIGWLRFMLRIHVREA
jgi:hypothetical protein